MILKLALFYPHSIIELFFQVCNSVCSGKRPNLPNTISTSLSELIKKCWHQNPTERPSCSSILQTLGKLSFPDNWKALLGGCGSPIKHDIPNGTTITNENKLNVISEDVDMNCGEVHVQKTKDGAHEIYLNEEEEKPRPPIFARSLSAPIPTPPPPPPMPKSHPLFISSHTLTPDPGKRSALLDSSNNFGYGITTEEIQKQRKKLKSRTR